MDELAPRPAPIRSSFACGISRTPRARAVVQHGGRALRLGRRWQKQRRAAAAASPSPATRTSPPIRAVAVRGRGRPRQRPRCACCASSPRSTAARRSIPTASRNQIEGGIVQSTELDAARGGRLRPTPASPAATGAAIRSCASPTCPDSVEVHVIDRPGQPFLGTGEAAQGPTAAAIANAVRQRDRRAHPRAAAQLGAGEGGDRGLSLA